MRLISFENNCVATQEEFVLTLLAPRRTFLEVLKRAPVNEGTPVSFAGRTNFSRVSIDFEDEKVILFEKLARVVVGNYKFHGLVPLSRTKDSIYLCCVDLTEVSAEIANPTLEILT